MSETRDNKLDEDALAITGLIASGVAGELSRPIRDLREKLAVVVDALDHHVANAKGPTPYPWKQVGELREQLAEAYLLSRAIARLSSDLATAVAPRTNVATSVDVNKVIESSLNLAGHRVSEETEVFVDYGSVPAARGHAPRLMLALSRLILRSAAATAGGYIKISSRRDGDRARLRVIDSGRHEGAGDDAVVAEVRRLLEGSEAQVEVSIDPEEGTVFDLHIPLATAT